MKIDEKMLKKIPRSLHKKLEIKDSKIHGHGLFATQWILSKTYLGEYLGQNIRWHPGVYIGNWTMMIRHKNGTKELRNARYGGNILKFINYSETSNIFAKKFRFYTLRNILPGEELVWDYEGTWK